MKSDWPVRALAEIATTGSGSTPKADKPGYYENGTVPFVRIADLTDGDVVDTELSVTERAVVDYRLKLRPERTLLIGMYGSIGKLGLLRIPATTNQAILAVNPIRGVVRVEFLFSYLLSQRHALVHSGFGGVQKNLSGAFLKKVLVPVPSLREQDEVVELFRAVQGMRTALQAQEAELDGLEASLLGEIFGEHSSEQ